MKTLYFHIGLQKTGTSTIQMSFMRPKGPLVQAGIDYLPGVIAPKHAHHSVAWDLRGHRRFKPGMPKLDDLLQAARASTADRLLASSEEFSLITPDQVTKLASDLSGFTVQPILCLRNQLNWSESLYAQACKRGYPASFSQFSDQLAQDGKLDFNALYKIWKNAFGQDNVHILIYEDHDDISDAFARVLGVSLDKTPARKNVSLNERFIQVTQVLIAECRAGTLSLNGQNVPAEQADNVASALLAEGQAQEQFSGNPVFLDHAGAQAFLDRWHDTNISLSQEVTLPESYFRLPTGRRGPNQPLAIDRMVLLEGLEARLETKG
jgi:hypothetical protein